MGTESVMIIKVRSRSEAKSESAGFSERPLATDPYTYRLACTDQEEGNIFLNQVLLQIV
jgi:hypothetical protein